jgi:glycerol-3-phosphate dehydrogenase
MEQVNILIIGGGLIGCAIAAEVSEKWQDVFVVERLPRVGMATSTRNSGVIHSGIYYPKNSLKARHCVEGNRLMYAFCEKHHVEHRRTGKLVVASEAEEQGALEALYARGRENGVEDLRMMGPAEIHTREPHVAGVAALEVPSTGILSAEELVKTLARLAVERGAHLVNRARVIALSTSGGGMRADVRIGDEADDEEVSLETIEARCVINAAGLYADEVAALMGNHSWKIYPVRGEYCEVRGPQAGLLNGLVYPLPHADGLSLGVHLTKTIWNTMLIGPTARYVADKDDYEGDRLAVEDFVPGTKKLLPEIEAGDLQLAYSGLRPKLVPPDQHGIADFVIVHDEKARQMIHLVGMESPGLTAAISVGKQVVGMVGEVLN